MGWDILGDGNDTDTGGFGAARCHAARARADGPQAPRCTHTLAMHTLASVFPWHRGLDTRGCEVRFDNRRPLLKNLFRGAKIGFEV